MNPPDEPTPAPTPANPNLVLINPKLGCGAASLPTNSKPPLPLQDGKDDAPTAAQSAVNEADNHRKDRQWNMTKRSPEDWLKLLQRCQNGDASCMFVLGAINDELGAAPTPEEHREILKWMLRSICDLSTGERKALKYFIATAPVPPSLPPDAQVESIVANYSLKGTPAETRLRNELAALIESLSGAAREVERLKKK